MNDNVFCLHLGNLECFVIRDGFLPTPSGQNIDLECICVKTEKHTILFDTGYGGMVNNTGRLARNLQDAGIHCSEIDTVAISHGHPDHIGGIIDTNNELMFRNARHFISKKEWDYWTSEPDLSRVDEYIRQLTLTSIKKNLLPLREQIHLLEAEGEIVPGITFIQAPGHTPGHITFVISSNKNQIFSLSDAFHTPIEIEKTNQFLTPPMTIEARESRDKILSQIGTEDLVFAGHFPFPGLGNISIIDNVRRWQPINKKQAM